MAYLGLAEALEGFQSFPHDFVESEDLRVVR